MLDSAQDTHNNNSTQVYKKRTSISEPLPIDHLERVKKDIKERGDKDIFDLHTTNDTTNHHDSFRESQCRFT